jgi:hypothetical protein
VNKLLVFAGVIIGAVAGVLFYRRSRRQARMKMESLRRGAEEANHKAEEESHREEEFQNQPDERLNRLEKETRPKTEEEEQLRQAEHPVVCATEQHEEQRVESPRYRLEEEGIRTEAVCDEAEEARRTDAPRRQAEELWQVQEKLKHLEAEREEYEARAQAELDERGQFQAERDRLGEEVHSLAEESQPKAEEPRLHEGLTESKRVEPGKRGGRPRTPQPRESEVIREQSSLQLRPEIVCFERNRQWVLALEVPEDSLPSSSLIISQNGSPLTEDESREGRWSLGQAFGQVAVRSVEGDLVKEFELGEHGNNYLLFRLSGKRGRRLKYLSSGAYLVIVPDNWKRADVFYGSAEPVALAGYQAYYCLLEKGADENITFRTPEDQPFVIQSKRSRFELVGTQVNGASEDIGPLFGNGPPRIRALDNQAWKGIGKIVVGEEGGGKGQWRKSFSPISDLIDQDLPAEVKAKKGGWYFLRFYDKQDELVESFDFRFARGLRQIKIFQPSPIPSEHGHGPARLEFVHDPGCIIRLAGRQAANLNIQSENEKTTVIVPPDPAFDQTYWDVRVTSTVRVKIQLLVERVWWGLGKENASSVSISMSDKPIFVNREDFAATSNTILKIWFPRPRWVYNVLLGFEKSKRRRHRVEVTKRDISIPLREFYSAEIEDRTQRAGLRLWLEGENTLEPGVVVCEALPETQSLSISIEDSQPAIQGEIESVNLDPEETRCCSTCDHARRRPDRVFSFKCMRHHWATVSDEAFQEKYSRYVCPEWQGEYYDAEGRYFAK